MRKDHDPQCFMIRLRGLLHLGLRARGVGGLEFRDSSLEVYGLSRV